MYFNFFNLLYFSDECFMFQRGRAPLGRAETWKK